MGFYIKTQDEARKHILNAYENYRDIWSDTIRCFVQCMHNGIKDEIDSSKYEWTDFGMYSKYVIKFMNGDSANFVDAAEYVVIANIININVRNYLHKQKINS